MTTVPIHGTPPSLIGRRLTGLIAEGFAAAGVLERDANVVFVCAESQWWRLVLDYGTVHWTPWQESPVPWSVPEKGWTYPHHDIALEFELNGRQIESLKVLEEGDTTGVQIELEGSKCFTFLEREGHKWVELR